MRYHDVVDLAAQGVQLGLEGVQVGAVELLVRRVHQRGLVAADEVGVVGGAQLEAELDVEAGSAGKGGVVSCL